MARERSDNFFPRLYEAREKLGNISLGDFKASELPALLGVLDQIDGITSVFHPSEEDLRVVESRIASIEKEKGTAILPPSENS